MQRHKVLNRAIVVLAAAIVVLGITLALTVPQELKDFARARYERMLSGDWGGGRGFVEGETFRGPFSGWGHHRFYGHGQFLTFLVPVLLLLLIGGFVLRRTAGFRHHSKGRDAVEILREKYASGEIGKDEYLARRRVLEDDGEEE